MRLEGLRAWQVVLLAGLVRAALICWAEYQDHHISVKYTDIDYVVFTDAARFVAAGGSPYKRATYRYSPLLAYMLLPNIWLHPAWGKVLFSVSDLVAAALLHSLLLRSGASRSLRSGALLLWLFNPFSATISTRGSCDVLSVLLLLGLLTCLLYGRLLASGALYGLAVHFRIYPVIYGPAIALFLMRRALALRAPSRVVCGSVQAGRASLGVVPNTEPERGTAPTRGGGPGAVLCNAGLRQRRKPTDRTEGSADAGVFGEPAQATRLQTYSAAAAAAAAALHPAMLFGTAAAASFLLLGAAFYRLYGREFLEEAFLHHLTRKDPRHNFSPYYYPIYLSYGNGSSSYSDDSSTQAGTAGAAESAPALRFVYDAWHAVRNVVPSGEPWRLALLPQAAAVLALAARFHEDLPSAWLLQTWAFVALNKVVTAQYFVWYLSLLPLVLPTLAVQRAVPHTALAVGVGAWVAAWAHWLAWAYQLEMLGRSVHLQLWAAGLAFLVANTALLVGLTRALRWGLKHSYASGGGDCGGGPEGCMLTFLEASLALVRQRTDGVAEEPLGLQRRQGQ